VLRGDVHQLAHARREVRGAGEPAAEVDPPASAPRHESPHDEPVIGRSAVGLEPAPHLPVGRQLELRLDLRLVATGADQLAAGAAPPQQAQGLDEDALARARLAGDHRQPGAERQLELVDQGEAGDSQQGQHFIDCFGRTGPRVA
jgi:hypothetical protein